MTVPPRIRTLTLAMACAILVHPGSVTFSRAVDCWDLEEVDCSFPDLGCNDVECNWSLLSGYYCPPNTVALFSGTTRLQCSDSGASGWADCDWNGDDPDWPIQNCEKYQSCGTSCIRSQIDGRYYCTGPVGPVYYAQQWYLPQLSNQRCRRM